MINIMYFKDKMYEIALKKWKKENPPSLNTIRLFQGPWPVPVSNV